MLTGVDRCIYEFYKEKYKEFTDKLYKKYVTSEFMTSAFDDVYITKVIYQDPATIVFWSDGTKTVAKCDKKDPYDEEKGLILCIIKKVFPSKSIGTLLGMWTSVTSDTYGKNTITPKQARKMEDLVNKSIKNDAPWQFRDSKGEN